MFFRFLIRIFLVEDPDQYCPRMLQQECESLTSFHRFDDDDVGQGTSGVDDGQFALHIRTCLNN